MTAALLGSSLAGTTAAAAAPHVCGGGSHPQANVNTSCHGGGNYFETSLAINPLNPGNVIGAVIKLARTPGQNSLAVEPRASFDGGATWVTAAVHYAAGQPAVDPSLAFDAFGTAYLVTTNNGDIVLVRSTDGGLTWSSPLPVAPGSLGAQGGVFNDHPQMTAFGLGGVIVTWIRDVFGTDGNLVEAPVYDSVSHDGGTTWSPPQSVSGSASFCTGHQGGHACDQTFGNSVAFLRGRAVVTFQQTTDEAPDAGSALGRDKYLSVLIEPFTGTKVAGPFLIGQAYDGQTEHDYPVSAGGVQTVHDSEFNLDGMGNTAVDPTDRSGRHFAIVWYDDRNAPHPVNSDPYQATTNADVIVSQSRDGGRTWSSPAAIQRPNDQFMPWAAYDQQGRLRIGFFDRSYDPANHKYGYTLATEVTPGSLTFTFAQVTTALSDPTRDSTASRGTINPRFPNPTVSIGDYTAVAAGPTSIATMWTDLRVKGCVNGRCGFTENAFFANMP
ncbi:MAG: glycoside hydrolase [Actinomycetota bacterium]|nr:glycoside hydrolase [Actinomycetota bacterium]